jgi:hypothetical protein
MPVAGGGALSGGVEELEEESLPVAMSNSLGKID